MIKEICSVDVSDLISHLNVLEWKPGGGGYAMIEEWPPTFQPAPVFDIVASYYPNKVRGFSVVSRLIPTQIIDTHTDHHDNHCKVRIHVPLVTNPLATLHVGAVMKNLEVGKVYEINPTLPHGCWNYGKEDRIHLIFNMKES